MVTPSTWRQPPPGHPDKARQDYPEGPHFGAGLLHAPVSPRRAAAHMGCMTLLNISQETADRFPDLAKTYAGAQETLAEAESHYGHLRTMHAEDEYIAAARGGDGIDAYTRIKEAREQYRSDCAAARTEYRAALQVKTDAYIAVLNAERDTEQLEEKAA